MSDSVWMVVGSVVVGDQGALVLGAELPVAPDAGGHGQQPVDDAGMHPRGAAAAVLLQAKLAFEGVDDRFDPLADRPKGAEPGRLVAAGRADPQPPPTCPKLLHRGP